MWLAANCKNGLGSYEASRCLGVYAKDGLVHVQRNSLAMQKGITGKFRGQS